MAKQAYVEYKPYVIPFYFLDIGMEMTRNTDSESFSPPLAWPFLSHGLSMWGITDGTRVQIEINRKPCFDDYLPARMFGSDLSFAELYKGLELEGRAFPEGRELPEALIENLKKNVQWRHLLGLPPFQQGDVVSLKVRGPVKQALFWGILRKESSA